MSKSIKSKEAKCRCARAYRLRRKLENGKRLERYREQRRNSGVLRSLVIRDFLNDFKKSGCSRCPEKFIECLEFHHRDPDSKSHILKERGSYGMIHRKWSIDRIKLELSKCDLLCANCHRIEHFRMNGGRMGPSKLRRLRWLASAGIIMKCVVCGFDDIACMEFNHRDPTTKFRGVMSCTTKNRIISEALKCDVLCANCHRKYTALNRIIVPGVGNPKIARFEIVPLDILRAYFDAEKFNSFWVTDNGIDRLFVLNNGRLVEFYGSTRSINYFDGCVAGVLDLDDTGWPVKIQRLIIS